MTISKEEKELLVLLALLEAFYKNNNDNDFCLIMSLLCSLNPARHAKAIATLKTTDFSVLRLRNRSGPSGNLVDKHKNKLINILHDVAMSAEQFGGDKVYFVS